MNYNYFILPFFLLMAQMSVAQNLSGNELLEKSIQYHDPSDNWSTWKPEFTLKFDAKNRPARISTVEFNNKNNRFHLTVDQEGRTVERIIKKGGCINLLDGKTTTDTALIKKYRLNCDRTTMYRNYYTYLYGLPMKLKDGGTIIHDEVARAEMDGKMYLRLKATYEAAVGEDIWYFYFDQNTYALKAYQFYHDEAKNDGEYILLEGETIIDGIKVPKDRTWYYNKDGKLLGSDLMVKLR